MKSEIRGSHEGTQTLTMVKTISLDSKLLLSSQNKLVKVRNSHWTASGPLWSSLTDNRCWRMNLLHQLGPPTKSATFICFTNSFTFGQIMTVVRAQLFSLWLIFHSFKVFSPVQQVPSRFGSFGSHDIRFILPVADHGFINFKFSCFYPSTNFTGTSD